ncbi:hypothetical protein [Nocardioides dongkuii]|uniref:hypothetical protein n=1 Tax=Nocardioides dongkuii TaxID=2760089 RepID=UPI00187871EA|nr:hypothetical protein [Nocardioides dongkuii]
MLVAGLVTWQVLNDDPYVAAPPPAAPAGEVDTAAARDLLTRFADAAATGDADAARALAPPDDSAAANLLAALVANAEQLRVRDLAVRYVDRAGPVAADGTWTARADVTWRFAGFDRRPARTEVGFGLRSVAGEVHLVSVGDGGARAPVWLTAPVTVRRTPGTLVLAADAADAERYADLATAAVPVVRRVLDRWRPRLVVEVPATAGDLDLALGAEPGTYAGIAAVTTSVDGSFAPGSPVHVLVNPEELGRLQPTGAQVVISHEATHVATGAPTSRTPLWLLEGFADHVALRDVALPVARTAAQAIEQVRRDGPPDALPGPAEFDVRAGHLGAVYESAWLACEVIVERAGERALIALNRDLADGSPLGPALRRHAGLSEAALVSAWRERLTDLAA